MVLVSAFMITITSQFSSVKQESLHWQNEDSNKANQELTQCGNQRENWPSTPSAREGTPVTIPNQGPSTVLRASEHSIN